MRPQDVIRRKRDGAALAREEIAFLVRGVANGEIADYQASAFLMAVFLKGMDEAEQRALTEEMLYSGTVLDFSEFPEPKADKHSTGGVGDKTSLLIAPLAAAVGLRVPMISGRGLGHTGGTLDKLEAIPGYRVRLTLHELRDVLGRTGFAMTGQTAEIAPADRKLYALRDATATVESVPLIVASILSKKLAAGLNALVLDVKTGSGAFMTSEGEARRLAHALVATANAAGVRTEALITDMNQPLGSAVGHAIEVRECLDLLRGEVSESTRSVLDLSCELTARMVVLADAAQSLDEARAAVRSAHASGAALERFRANVEAQGGDPRVCDDPPRLLPLTDGAVEVKSTRTGFINNINAAEIGYCVALLGGGRVRAEDAIDPRVGYLSYARVGDHVCSGDALGLLYCHREQETQTALFERLRAAYRVADEIAAPPTLIKEIINA
ncbi:MAG TPA: thymidine phosphorylase [Pyrinomonadaceae bacterium]|jgi:pyrimidine-nucleoside phosphorylase/thymidine phosphorylase|nr:thymidine phosphorylase [Pyrinomonadaceae bacterium]